MNYKARIKRMTDRIDSTDPSPQSIASELAVIAGLIVHAEAQEGEHGHARDTMKDHLEAGANGHDLWSER